jgi:hypothetical protein
MYYCRQLPTPTVLPDATTPAGTEFMSRFGFIEVLTPIELLKRVPKR